MKIKLKHVYREVDRHGKERFYYRHEGRGSRSPLPHPESQEFPDALAVARTKCGAPAVKPAQPEKQKLGRKPKPAPKMGKPAPGTLHELCVRYFKSPDFMRLDERTRYVRRQIIEHCLQEPIAPGAKETFAEIPLDRLTPKAIRVLRDRKADFPEAGNNRVKAFRQLFKWGLEDEAEGLDRNHARDVAYFPSSGDGFHAWTVHEVAQFEKRHPIGTKARLALALLLYTGQRRSDVVLMGRQHVRDGWMRLTQFKGRKRKPVTLEIPILPELAEIIEASPTGDLTYLVTEYGRPFTSNGFGNWFRDRCNEAGLPQCSAHGLRKAAAARLAESGCTIHEIMSITGHMTIKEVERYTRGVRQRALAGAAADKVRNIRETHSPEPARLGKES
ncbi:integrase [Chelatococcus caeni]|uniref:Integrase n=1 Tax=Chelatococcus caeni TaxID=1348468 RepID=A0A840C0I4_9HYPH|nr:tyrosine-type recombinase/integrase [Chelatococcus caeni]MBB4017039.1 integrase [Chelatococcus caeni]